jgi:hypothetical protein
MKKHFVTLGVVAGTLLLGPAAPASAQEVYNPYTRTYSAAPVANPYVGGAAAVRNPYTGTTTTTAAAYNLYTGASAHATTASNPYTGAAAAGGTAHNPHTHQVKRY